MYYKHFGLNGAPFQFTPSPKLLFMSKAHREALSALEWGLLQEPSGFTLMIGETGAGKTTLIVSILARNYERVRSAYVTNPRLGLDAMLHDILRQLGVTAAPNKLAMSDAFDQFLAGLGAGERVVIIVDEAQSLSDEMLEDLRLFSNRGRLDEKQVHFVFAGQPALLRRLMEPGLKQINERIGIRSLLNPLERAEATAYVEYRLAAFGGSSAAVFGRGALDYLMDHSGGIPRRINVLCHNAMLTAYNMNQPTVTIEAARAAVAEYENLLSRARRFEPRNAEFDVLGEKRPAATASARWSTAIIGAMAIAAMATFLMWNSRTPRREEPVSLDAADAVGDAVTEHPNAGYLPASIITEAPEVEPADASETSARASDATGPMADLAGTANPGLRRIRVQPGNTLARIAADQLGSADQLARLVRANPQVRDPNHILAGEMVNLPARETTAQAARTGAIRTPGAENWQRVTTRNVTAVTDEE